MVRFSQIVLTYLIIGAVMFGGGAIQWDNVGASEFFVDGAPGDLDTSDQTQDKLSGVGGSIKSIVDQFAGPIVVIWNLAVGLTTYLNWPIVVLTSANAPPSMVLLLGVPLTAAFYLSILKLVRSSA